MPIEDVIVANIMTLFYGAVVIGALWGGLTGFLLYRTYVLEKQLKMLTATIEANLFRKRDVMKKE